MKKYTWFFTIVKDGEIKSGELISSKPASLIAFYFEIKGYQVLTLSRAAIICMEAIE